VGRNIILVRLEPCLTLLKVLLLRVKPETGRRCHQVSSQFIHCIDQRLAV
jgi:hypothetical protein